MEIIERILQQVADIHLPGFFVTTEFSKTACDFPVDIATFLHEKYQMILKGANGRKFIYQNENWRIIFTFFPTNQVVDDRYALKNKVQIRKQNLK